jgi:hypothetical protein
LDVLIVDATKPVLFRDADLVFVTPDAVLGVMEVKSRARPSLIREAAEKLGQDMLLIRRHPNTRAFAGVFAFDEDGGETSSYLDAVVGPAQRAEEHIDFVCVGDSRFIRYWELDPERQPTRLLEAWHSYHLAGLARGYFIHNVVDSVSPEAVFRNNEVWFPREGKEPYRDGVRRANWAKGEC